jgi:anti-anti-sigma factor
MIEYKITKNKLVVSFPVRLDNIMSSKLDEELHEKIEEHSLPLVFNMKDVEYIASMFLRIVQKVYLKIGSNNFFLINVNPNLKKVLKISGFDQYLNINSPEITI